MEFQRDGGIAPGGPLVQAGQGRRGGIVPTPIAGEGQAEQDGEGEAADHTVGASSAFIRQTALAGHRAANSAVGCKTGGAASRGRPT